MACGSQLYDAAVIGLGAMGAGAIWQLAERGLSVVGFDAFHPPHDMGSSHGRSRIIREAYFEGAVYVPLVQRAYELWRELEAAQRESLLTICGGVMIGEPSSPLVAGARERCPPAWRPGGGMVVG